LFNFNDLCKLSELLLTTDFTGIFGRNQSWKSFEYFRQLFITKQVLILENLMLRQQLNIYKRKNKRPKFENIDRIILVWISRIFNDWKSALVVAKASTLIGWHKKGFKLYWKRKSRRVGRPNIDWELIKLVRRMQKENPLWSAQRIQGELEKLGFSVCDNTVAKYMRKPKTDPEKIQRWLTFLRNHAKYTVGIDFLVARTIFFKSIYVFVAISHDRRKILHFAVSSNPHSQWAIQQLRETFAFDETTKYVIRDNDGIYSDEFKANYKTIWAGRHANRPAKSMAKSFLRKSYWHTSPRMS